MGIGDLLPRSCEALDRAAENSVDIESTISMQSKAINANQAHIPERISVFSPRKIVKIED